jgi:hypothetical protein
MLAYVQDGVVLSRVFRSPTDAAMFEIFIAELLQHFQSIFKSYIMSLAAYHSDIEDRCSLVAFREFF